MTFRVLPSHGLHAPLTERGGWSFLRTSHTQPRNHSPGNQLRPRVVQFPFQLQIGCHTDDLMSASKLSRAPVVTHQCHMDRTEQSVSNLWGGLLYVIVPTGCNLGPVSITIKRAVPAPYYKLGEWTERGGGERGMLCSCGLVAKEQRRKDWWTGEGTAGDGSGGRNEKSLCPWRLQGRTQGRVWGPVLLCTACRCAW